MWYFYSPQIFYGEDALSWLTTLRGQRAFIVTDENMLHLGFVAKVQSAIDQAGVESAYFAGVEPNPCLETVKRAAAEMENFKPDWIIGLGGGSSMDAAKAAWFIYERPDVDPTSVNPMNFYGIRSKARLITIPTTSGSGAEVTQAAIITDTLACRKLEMPSPEILADVTIVDPVFSAHMPASITADTGIDALTHAIEGYSSSWFNDFCDGLNLQATRLIFQYLLRAVKNGAEDMEAREKMAIAATMAGLGMGNSHIALAHALGHSAGALFELPHGRVTGLFLPNTIDFNTNGGAGRYLELAHMAGLVARNEQEAGKLLSECIRDLMRSIDLPLSLQETGISKGDFESKLEALCDRTLMDASMATSRRIPSYEEIIQLYEYAYRGERVDF